MSDSLTPAQREAADRALVAIRADRGPMDPQIPGCLVAFFGMALLTLVPPASNWLEISQELARFSLGLGAFLLFAGALLPFLIGWARGGTHELRACREAARTLERWAAAEKGDPAAADDEVVHAAVSLILNACTVRGPTTTRTPGFERIDAHLDDALPLLRAVELHLLRTGSAYPVFTGAEPRPLP